MHPIPNDDAIEQLKFSECLSRKLAVEVFMARFHDPSSIHKALSEPRRIVFDSVGSDSTITIESSRGFRPKKKSGGKSKTSAKSFPPADPKAVAELAGTKALSIRQPHAEAIFRGTKTTEYRAGPTKIRGRILIYASLGRYEPDEEAGMLEEYEIDDVSCDDLPRGVLIGSVELYDCDEGEWYLRDPKRLDTPVKPTKHPQPVWFNPF
jgi:hypothetical protein